MNDTIERLMSELDRLVEIRDELASDIARMGRTGRFGSIDCQDRVKAMETIGAQLRRVESALDACEEQSNEQGESADVTNSTSTTDNLDKNVQFSRNATEPTVITDVTVKTVRSENIETNDDRNSDDTSEPQVTSDRTHENAGHAMADVSTNDGARPSPGGAATNTPSRVF